MAPQRELAPDSFAWPWFWQMLGAVAVGGAWQAPGLASADVGWVVVFFEALYLHYFCPTVPRSGHPPFKSHETQRPDVPM